jgi:hypothetical protein
MRRSVTPRTVLHRNLYISPPEPSANQSLTRSVNEPESGHCFGLL